MSILLGRLHIYLGWLCMLTLKNRHLLREVEFMLLESSSCCRQDATDAWQMLLILKEEVGGDQ